VLAREPAPGSERERAKTIFLAHGRSSISPAALLPDKRYCFSEGGSVVAYVVRNGVALALAEPIGPLLDLDEAVATFHELCAAHGWIPAWYETGPEQLDRFQDFGYKAICLGHEAVVNLRAFSLEGGHRKDLRGKYRRVERDGYSARIHEPPHPEPLLDALAEVSDEWLLRAKGREKRFTLGWFDRDYLNQGPLMVVHDADDRPMAFVNITTVPRMNEASIDLMRHRQQIEKNTMLFLFTALMLWARDAGYERFNMGMAPLYGVGDEVDDPVLDRALHMVYERGGRLYGFKGLQFFKSQFRPDWSPRYLIHPGIRSLPAVAVAIVSASSGDDFAREAMRDAVPTERLAAIFGRNGEPLVETASRPTAASISAADPGSNPDASKPQTDAPEEQAP
jgi:phosphatidylglycerol lysyltransferase